MADLARKLPRKPVMRLASLKRPAFQQRHVKKTSARSKGSTNTCPNPNCPAPNIVDDDDKRVCTGCGTVISDSNIVSEVTFGENAVGGAVVQGTFVGADQAHARTVGPGFRRTGGMESREITDANGRRFINQLATALNIPQDIGDRAMQIFKLAAGANFIQGRKTRNVAAVCLYIACRRQKENTTMLIDLADVLNLNVFKLGSVYSNLVKNVLYDTGVPPVNPEALLYRFAKQLEFGTLQQTMVVAKEAVYILKRMKRDWMVTGRRPAGVCGAALILAARMNNYRRTVREVVYIVKVTDMTLHKRLDEFKITDSADLTVEEFRKVDLPQTHDPPSFTKKSKRRMTRDEKKQASRKRKRGGTGNSDEARVDKDGFAVPESLIDPALTASTESSPPSSTAATGTTDTSASTTITTPDNQIMTNNILSVADEVESAMRDVNVEVDANARAGSVLSGGVTAASPNEKKRLGRPKGSKNKPLPTPTEEDLRVEAELEEQMLEALQDPKTIEAAAGYAEMLATSQRGGSAVLVTAEVGEDEFADDPEVQNCLLSQEEIAIKERIWVHENRDWLRTQQSRLLKRQLEELNGTARPAKKRKKNNGRMGDQRNYEGGGKSIPSTPAEATRLMLERRGFSKKINYAKLDDLYGPSVSASADASATGSASASRAGSPAPSAGSSSFLQPSVSARKAGDRGSRKRSPKKSKTGSESEDAIDASKEVEPTPAVEEKKEVALETENNDSNDTLTQTRDETDKAAAAAVSAPASAPAPSPAAIPSEARPAEENDEEDAEDEDEDNAQWYEDQGDNDDEAIHNALAGLMGEEEDDGYGDDYDEEY